MNHWWTRRLQVGLLGIAIILITMWGCGRERVNPIDSQYEGEGGVTLNAPGNIRAQGGIGRITLNWNPVNSTTLAGYGIWRSTSATADFVLLRGESSVPDVTTARTTFVDSTIDANVSKIYFYKLSTVDVDGQSSELSTFVSAEVLDDTRAPAMPTNLVAITDADGKQVTLGWSAPETDVGNQELTGLSGYRIFRIKDSQGKLQIQGSQAALVQIATELGIDLDNLGAISDDLKDIFVELATVPAGQTYFLDTDGLEAGVLHVYVVIAVDSEGNTGPPALTLVTISAPGANVPVPAGLRATKNEQARIVISWNPVNDPNLLGYLVLRSQSTQGPFTSVTSDTLLTTGQTTYVDSLVATDQVYYYKVQTVVQDPQLGLLHSDTSTFTDGQALADQSAPGAPSDLIVSLDDDNFQRVMLNWTAPVTDRNGDELTGLASFEIYRSRDNNTSFALIATVSSDQVSFVDTSVELLTTYFYAIRALDQAGNAGPRSQPISVTTKGFAVPRNVRATSGVQKITLTWTANTEPELTGYEILRFTDPTHETPDRTFSSVLTTYVDTPVTADQPFVYRVRAVGTANVKSELSAPISAQANESAPVLAAPRNVQARGGIGHIAITWSANTEAELTGYRVMRYTDPAQTVAEATFATVQTTYVDSPLVSGQTYVYRVQAVGTNNEESERSLYASATVSADQSPPGAPSDLILSLDEANFQRVLISWTAPTRDSNGNELTGLASFEIYRSRDNNTSFALIAAVSSDQMSYEDTSVELLTRYFYAIRALDQADNAGPRSQPVSVTTKGFAIPRNVQAAAGELKITLNWSANTEPELIGYEILRFTDPSQETPDKIFSSVLTTYVDTPVTAGQTFVYRVRAVGPSNLKSDLSAFVSAQAIEPPPVLAAPRNVRATGGELKITLTWTANTEPEWTGYEILRFTDPTHETPDRTFSSVLTTYVDTPVTAAQPFFYRVRAVGTANEKSDLSAFVSAQAIEPPPVLAAPRNVRATGGIGYIALTWSANTEAELTGYRVMRYTDPAQTVAEATFMTVHTTYVDSPLVADQTYVYRVQAVGINNTESESSLFASATVLIDDIPPATPGNFVAVLASSGAAIELSWDAPTRDANGGDLTGLASFVIYRADPLNNNVLTELTTLDATHLEYRDRDLLNRTTYRYQISAIDHQGNESARSPIRTVTTTDIVPVPPTDLQVSYNPSVPEINLTWTPPDKYDHFIVQRAAITGAASGAAIRNLTDSDYTTLETEDTITTPSYSDRDIKSGFTYVYRVRTSLSGRVGAPSDTDFVFSP